MEREIEQERIILAQKQDFNLIDGFRCFDQNERGFVRKEEIL